MLIDKRYKFIAIGYEQLNKATRVSEIGPDESKEFVDLFQNKFASLGPGNDNVKCSFVVRLLF